MRTTIKEALQSQKAKEKYLFELGQVLGKAKMCVWKANRGDKQ